MRGYLMLATYAAIGAVPASCVQSTTPPITAQPEPTPAMTRFVVTWTYVVATPSFEIDLSQKPEIKSHPSFSAYVPGFPDAYTRDACLRSGWDRPLTIQEPYSGDARDSAAQNLSELLMELRDAEAKWRVIQEKHGITPSTP